MTTLAKPKPIAAAAAPPPAAAEMPAYAVELRGLTKTYRGAGRMKATTALDAIDLAIPRGSIFGLLGPNGAGKSTLINILAGLVVKSAGHASVWGIDIDADPRHARAAIGVVPQELNIDAFFTPREMLEVQAGMYGVPRAERRTTEILGLLGLADKADSYARTLSGGMRRRLMVAKAMVHSPPVLVLDEPTAGVDVELRRQLWTLVQAMNAAGTTILLTTHYLDEAEELCDRIAIINHGRLIACDTTAALVQQVDDKTLTIALVEPVASLPPALSALGLALIAPDRLLYRYGPSRTRLDPVLAAIRATGLTIRDLATEETDLEEVFLRLTRSKGKVP
ncbi:MAG: ABC transporter ATP-binding protein [Stellaceae bacterium]